MRRWAERLEIAREVGGWYPEGSSSSSSLVEWDEDGREVEAGGWSREEERDWCWRVREARWAVKVSRRLRHCSIESRVSWSLIISEGRAERRVAEEAEVVGRVRDSWARAVNAVEPSRVSEVEREERIEWRAVWRGVEGGGEESRASAEDSRLKRRVRSSSADSLAEARARRARRVSGLRSKSGGEGRLGNLRASQASM